MNDSIAKCFLLSVKHFGFLLFLQVPDDLHTSANSLGGVSIPPSPVTASSPLHRTSRRLLTQEPFGKKRWTVDETLAFLLGVKIRHGLSDDAFFALLEGENASMDPDSVLRPLPVSMYKTSKELDGFIPFHFKYVTYCPKCETVIKTSTQCLKQAECHECGDDLTDLLLKGGCTFIVLPVRKQIEAYCSRPKFQSLVRKFRQAKHGKLMGPTHEGVVEDGHFSLTVATDGAVLSKWSKTTLFPIFMFFNNIPISYQVVYPILCALYCGPSRFSPPRHVFFKYLVEELRSLECNPIQWKYENGQRVTSFSFVTLCCTDAVEKAKVMNHKGHSGYYSCPYCKYKGEAVSSDPASSYPTKPKGKGGGGKGSKIKFPKLNHEEPIMDWRQGKERVQIGERIVRSLAENSPQGNFQGVDGVLGLGVLNMFSKFDETDSHTAGLLHVVCEGIFKDIINLVVLTEGEPYSLKKKDGTWDNVEMLLGSRFRVSEANFNCKSPRVYNTWRAYDYYQLLIHDVALLFSDERIITDEQFQRVIFLLAEAVYFLCHGRMTPEIRRLAREKVEAFSTAFVLYFGPEWCTYKFHIFQHMPDLVDRHGPAFLWDDFNLERINNLAKDTISGTRAQMEQVARHFILGRHSDVLQDPSCYQSSVQEQLKKVGFHQEAFFSYDDFVTDRLNEPLDGFIHDAVLKYLVNCNLCELGETPRLSRVTRMVRKNVVVLTSKHYKHRGLVRDWYVQVEGNVFGEISEIISWEENLSFFLVIEKFRKVDALYSKGNSLLHPVNQFPYERLTTKDIEVIEMTDDLFIQKAQISVLVLAEGTIVNLFSPRPNEYFRF